MGGINGGKRPGAGRPPGAINKRTQETIEAVAASGETPLEYMTRIYRDPTVDHARRDDMAKAAAPYVHPKLATTDNTNKVDLTGGVTWLPPS
jgi:hypothetical protein